MGRSSGRETGSRWCRRRPGGRCGAPWTTPPGSRRAGCGRCWADWGCARAGTWSPACHLTPGITSTGAPPPPRNRAYHGGHVARQAEQVERFVEKLVVARLSRPNGRPSRTRSCTAPGCPPTVRKTRPSAGSPSGTAMITFISPRCWPARTAANPACPGNGTRSAPPASPPSSATGCAPPHPPTAPLPAVRAARRTRRPPAVAWRRPRGSRCGGRSPPLRRQRAARASSSPAWTRPGCWCASGSASATPVRSPGTRSPCPATPPRTADRSGTAAGNSRRT